MLILSSREPGLTYVKYCLTWSRAVFRCLWTFSWSSAKLSSEYRGLLTEYCFLKVAILSALRESSRSTWREVLKTGTLKNLCPLLFLCSACVYLICDLRSIPSLCRRCLNSDQSLTRFLDLLRLCSLIPCQTIRLTHFQAALTYEVC